MVLGATFPGLRGGGILVRGVHKRDDCYPCLGNRAGAAIAREGFFSLTHLKRGQGDLRDERAYQR